MDTELLYDLDFDDVISGQVPASDSESFPRHGPSRVYAHFLSAPPIVRHGRMVMGPQGLAQFDMPATFFALPVRVEMDVEPIPDPSRPSSGLVLFLETPSSQSIIFNADGTIDVRTSIHFEGGQEFEEVGRYRTGRAVRLTVLAFPGREAVHERGAREGTLSIFVDTELIWTGPYYTHAHRPEAQRITLAHWGRFCSFVDNVDIRRVEDPTGGAPPAKSSAKASPIRLTGRMLTHDEVESRMRACSS